MTFGWSRLMDLFERQFEPDGDQFLYRRNLKGSPIRVSRSERDKFVDDYALRLRRGNRGIFASLAALTFLAVGWIIGTGLDLPETAIYVAMGTVAAVSIYYVEWAGRAPSRELARRTPIGRERTKAEVRKIWLKNTSYAQLAGTSVLGILACFGAANRNGAFVGESKIWLALAGGLIILTAIQGYRKWRLEQDEEVR